MPLSFSSANHARDLYIEELQTLVDYGEPVDVRGRQTLEILNYITEVREPWHHCILLPSRRWNPWLAMSEALWILAGRNDVEALEPYNQHIGDYSDDGDNLYGAYGPRIFAQVDPLIERLRKDPSDRRAVISIWQGDTGDGYYAKNDLTAETKDPPCNDMLLFKLRQGKLHMTVICRSNDIHWGLFAVNLPTFGILQEYIAARLGVGIGYQTHLSNSLHVYLDEPAAVEITERMLYGPEELLPIYPKHELTFAPGDWQPWEDHKMIAEWCSDVLNEKYLGGWPPFLKFASLFLKAYREHDLGVLVEDKELLRDRYSDWVLAAQIFSDKVWHRERSRI